MYEEQFIVTLWVCAALALWVIKLKWTNRKLRKQMASGPAPDQVVVAPAPPQAVERDPEVERLRDRVAILERITVEKESSLAREIESLRYR